MKTPLTVEILKTMPFQMTMHLNGGNKFSKRVSTNEEWNLGHVVETDGSPKYRITSDMLYMLADHKVSLDLRAKDKDLSKFVQAYNEAYTLRVCHEPAAAPDPNANGHE